MAADNSCGHSSSQLRYYTHLPTQDNSAHLHHKNHLPPHINSQNLPGPPLSGYPSGQGICSPAYSLDSWAASLAEGVSSQSAILDRDGYACLSREEYQLFTTDFTAITLNSSQKDIISPPSTSSPLCFDSAASISSQDESGTPPEVYPRYRSSKVVSTRKHKCPLHDCPYSSARQDHVRSHFKAHHEGNRYMCNQCGRKYVFKGDFDSHFPCSAPGKEINTPCPLCGSIVNKKGLKRHKKTPKCKYNQIARTID